MQRFTAAALTVLLVVSACGGSSDDASEDSGADQSDTSQAATTQAATQDTASDQTAPPTTSGGDDGTDAEGSGPSTATVTLGGETYNFSTEGAVVAQCLTDLFGIFSVQLPMVDDSGAQADGSVAIVALREGTDPDVVDEVNSIEVAIGDEDWVADEADMMFEQSDLLEPGMSQVDSVEIDGRTVRGTATFFRQGSVFTDEIETQTGTFEATCGEERTS
jgi:hypothetical protein